MLLAALGGALTALALPLPGIWLFGWFGLALVIGAANGVRAGCAARRFFAAGCSFHAVALFWVYSTCRFALVPVPAAAFAWGLLAVFMALPWALVGFLGRAFCGEGSRGLRPWVWAVVWTAVAAAGERWTPRLQADLLVHTQWPNLALLQAGAWGGPHLVGFVVALFNAALAEAWTDSRENKTGPALPPLAAALGLAAALWAHGTWVLVSRPAPGPSLRVEILQPNVDQYEKWDGDKARRVWANLEELLARPRPSPPALVVWPETAVPRWGVREDAPVAEAAVWAARTGSFQLVGAVTHSAEGPHNSAQLIAPDGTVAACYRKRELVPFGEFVPFRALIPRWAIERWFAVLDRFEDLDPGAKEQPLLDLPWGKAAASICYESAFPRWARRDAARGARLLVNITNDGWYKDTWGPYQHLRVNVFRAIETRTWVVRSGNTGISAVISPWGEVTASLPLNERGRLDAEVPLADPFPARSFYVRHGDWLGSLCLALTGLLLALRAVVRP